MPPSAHCPTVCVCMSLIPPFPSLLEEEEKDVAVVPVCVCVLHVVDGGGGRKKKKEWEERGFSRDPLPILEKVCSPPPPPYL